MMTSTSIHPHNTRTSLRMNCIKTRNRQMWEMFTRHVTLALLSIFFYEHHFNFTTCPFLLASSLVHVPDHWWMVDRRDEEPVARRRHHCHYPLHPFGGGQISVGEEDGCLIV
jgi:hypothetical protein